MGVFPVDIEPVKAMLIHELLGRLDKLLARRGRARHVAEPFRSGALSANSNPDLEVLILLLQRGRLAVQFDIAVVNSGDLVRAGDVRKGKVDMRPSRSVDIAGFERVALAAAGPALVVGDSALVAGVARPALLDLGICSLRMDWTYWSRRSTTARS